MAAMVSPAVAGSLTRESTGADYVAATNAEKLEWVLRMGALLHEKTGRDRLNTASIIAGCLSSSLEISGTREERSAARMLRRMKLAELTALCVVMTPD
jgi:hypothetical protein